MKTYESVTNMKNGQVVSLGQSPLGTCVVRRTKKGAIATNSKGNWYAKEVDFLRVFGNINAIGAQSLEHVIRSRTAAFI